MILLSKEKTRQVLSEYGNIPHSWNTLSESSVFLQKNLPTRFFDENKHEAVTNLLCQNFSE